MSEKKVTSFDQLKMLAERAAAEDKALSQRIDKIVSTGGEPNVLVGVKVNGTPAEYQWRQNREPHDRHRHRRRHPCRER